MYHTMVMHFFRRGLDLSHARIRAATPDDLSAIGTLLREAGRRYFGLAGSDLGALLAAVPAVVLEADNQLWGVAISGWRANRVTWLRCVAVFKGLNATDAVDALLPALHAALRARGLQHIFYAGDENADTWLLPILQKSGYVVDTHVVVYEKHNLTVPSEGNESLIVRPAESADLSALVTLDNSCFEAHWTMNETTMSAAILEQSFLVVAQNGPQLVGYAYASSHFSGRLVHLVRIAVDPRQQGNGVGSRLLKEVVSFARQEGADLVTLNTQSYNERAQQLYRWFGFAPNGEYQAVLRYDL
jgi:N-acetylglutamate synthase-like GNAT family acetyltransferase